MTREHWGLYTVNILNIMMAEKEPKQLAWYDKKTLRFIYSEQIEYYDGREGAKAISLIWQENIEVYIHWTLISTLYTTDKKLIVRLNTALYAVSSRIPLCLVYFRLLWVPSLLIVS